MRRILAWIIAFTLFVVSAPVTGAAAESETGGADSESITADKIQVGDYIELGSYNGKPVKWRCIGYGSPTNPQRYSNVQNDYITDWNYVMYESDAASGEVPLFLADEVLCNKAFDAASAEGNAKQSSHNLRTESAQYGSNLWSDSNIRDWLNSDAPAGEVEWTCGNVPDAEHIAGSQGEENFPYDMEAGFLSNFTDEEQRVMMTVRQKQILGKPDADWTDNTKQYGYDRYNDTKTENISISSFPSDEYGRCYYRLSTDTMFLLDIKQADTLYKNCTADKLGSDYYQGEYFLRSPLVHSAQPDVYVKAFSSSKSSNIECISANSESGIRPAFYACETAKSVSGDGSKDNPYILKVPVTPDETISAKKIKVGDYVEMGTYYGEMIRWRCVGFDKILRYEEDGTPVRKDNGYKGIFSNDTERLEIVDLVQSQEWKEGYLPIMISEHVITFKPYDANCDDDANCEGTSHAYRTNEGKTSNCWSDSNLRSWLNSDAAAGEVEWLCGNPPDRSHVDQGVNAYDGEAGFLSNFTENELGAIKEASRKVVLSLTDKEKAEAGTGRYETAQFKFYKEIPDKIELTEECEDKIRAAREAYDGLSQKAQALVLDKTLEKLSTAETELANLKAIDGVDKSVEDLVETMGDGITVDNIITVGEKIKAAHKAYDDLAPNLQAKVANYEALTTAETAYEEAATVSSIKFMNLDQSKKIELTLGTAAASAQLEAEILPATAAVVQKAEWSSSKEGIVSVIGEGVRVTVAAAAAGETETTVRAGQEEDSCTVSVKEAPEDTVAVERIDLNQTEVQLDLKENQTVQLEASVYPANAFNSSLEWSIDAKDVAIVTAEGNKATVTAAAAGTATVTVQSTAFPSIRKECKITVKADGGSAEDSELTDMEAEKTLNDALHAAEDIYEYGSTSEENAAIYTPDTWNRFQEAYEAAKNLKADATPAEKKALADAADDARRALVPDASKLTENTANALANAMVSNTGNFEDVSWNDYEAAFGKLKEAAESGSATEKELAELLVLFHAAEKKLKADDDWLGAKQGLDSVLAAADTYLGKQSQYERAAWEAFMTAYNDAQDLSKATKATATQQAIEETAKALNDAVTKLLASPVKPADSTTQDPVSKNPAAEEPEEPEEPEIEEDDYKDIKGIRYSVTDVDKRTVSAAAVTSSKKKLTKVSIPDTVDIEGVMFFVTEIQSGGFKKCTKITKVTLGRNVQKIGNSAFEGCSKMTSLNVMGTEKVSFGKKSFYNCKKLGKIIIKSKNPLFVKKAFSKTKRGASVTLSKKIAKNERNNIKKILKTAGIKNGRYKFK